MIYVLLRTERALPRFKAAELEERHSKVETSAESAICVRLR